MHELGIVFHLIEQVNKLAVENHVNHIASVTLEVGEVSAVIPYFVEDCWNWAVKKETVLKNSKIKIEQIDAVSYCEDCKKEYSTVEHAKICPYCGSEHTYLLRGNEICLKEIEVIDDEAYEEPTEIEQATDEDIEEALAELQRLTEEQTE